MSNWFQSAPAFLSRLVYKLGGGKLNAPARKRQQFRHAFFQQLESRNLMATFTVDNSIDENDGNTTAGNFSLREAIIQANNTAGADTINFNSNLITTFGNAVIRLNGTPLPSITDDVTITGLGADKLIISGTGFNGSSLVFHVTGEGKNVGIEKLTVQDGTGTGALGPYGGGILNNRSNLVLNEVVLKNNRANFGGGGIANISGNLEINNSSIEGNSATLDAAGIYSAGANPNPSLLVVNSTISGNQANRYAGAIWARGGESTIAYSTLVQNVSNANGTDDDVSTNVAEDGGAIMIDNPLFFGQTPGLTLNLLNSIVAGNLTGASGSRVANDLYGFVNGTAEGNVIGSAGSSGGISNSATNRVGVNGAGVRALDTILNTTPITTARGTTAFNLVASSPAINFGGPFSIIYANDQAGRPRGEGDILTDSGAKEFFGPRIYLPASMNASIQLFAPFRDVGIFNPSGMSGTVVVTSSQNLFAILPTSFAFDGTIHDSLSGTIIGSYTKNPGLLTLNFTSSLDSTVVLSTLKSIQYIAQIETSFSIQATTIAGDQGPAAVINVRPATPVNVAPVLTIPATPAVNFVEDFAAQLIAGNATLTDADSPNFQLGALLVKITVNASPDDRLTIAPLTKGTLPVSVTGTTTKLINVGGVVVGTVAGGVGATQLAIAWNANATPDRVQAVIRRIAYSNVSQAPSTERRTIVYRISDGDGGERTASKQITVTARNDAPVIQKLVARTTRRNSVINFASAAVVKDVDQLPLTGGNFILSTSVNGFLSTRNRSGNNIVIGGVVIGTVSTAANTNRIAVRLNAKATPARLTTFLRSITFRSPNAGAFGISYSLTDGRGGLTTGSIGIRVT